MSKAEAHIDIWLKEIAPSTELREWFNHDPAKWEEFKQKYREEQKNPEKARLVEDISLHARSHDITLVYGAKDTAHNDAVVLKEIVEEHIAAVNT